MEPREGPRTLRTSPWIRHCSRPGLTFRLGVRLGLSSSQFEGRPRGSELGSGLETPLGVVRDQLGTSSARTGLGGISRMT